MKRKAAFGALLSLGLAAAGCSAGPDGGGSVSTGGAVGTSHCNLVISRPSARLLLTDAVLASLVARAKAGDSAWSSLTAKCDSYSNGKVFPPNGNAYPNSPDLGAGYQGEDYVGPMMSLGLCYRVSSQLGSAGSASAAKYARAGATLLDAIATPVASGGQAPKTDSGYGIRNYVVAMAYGFDWLYPSLSAASKSRAIAAMNTWIDWYDTAGFSRGEPIGNYFAGYLLAKTATAIATDGDNANAAAYWGDVQTHLYAKLVQPAFATSMKGGGWPEGWEYGPKAVREMAEFFWITKTSKGTTWFDDLGQVRDQAAYLRYFVWPSLSRMDDQGTVRGGVKLAPSSSLAIELAGILGHAGDNSAAVARSFASDVMSASGDDSSEWMRFLFWNPALANDDYTKKPLSYFASGPGHVAARSSWAKDSTWVSLSGGRYINAPDSGEQLFGQGAFSMIAGKNPVIVNATGWIPSVAASAGEDFVYSDSWGKKTRALYNTFFVNDAKNPNNPGQAGMGPGDAATGMDAYEEATGFTRARASKLEGMYAGGVVGKFTRDLVFVRPSSGTSGGTAVLFDRTTVTSPGADHWMAFHVPVAPTQTSVATGARFDVGTEGSLFTVLPVGATSKVVSLPGGVSRIENHATGATNEWLHVVSAGKAPSVANISSSDVVGVQLKGSEERVVAFARADACTAATYTTSVPAAKVAHVLAGVAPSASGYAVTAAVAGGKVTISVKAGGPIAASAAGDLSFDVTPAGVVSSTGWTSVPTTSGSMGTGATASTAPAGTGGGSASTGSAGGSSAGTGSAGSSGSAGTGSTGSTGSTGTGETVPSTGSTGTESSPSTGSGIGGSAGSLPTCQ